MNQSNPLAINGPFDIPTGTYRELDLLASAKRAKQNSPLGRLLDQFSQSPVIVLKAKVLPTIIGEWKNAWHELLRQQVPDMILANRYLDELELLERTVDKVK